MRIRDAGGYWMAVSLFCAFLWVVVLLVDDAGSNDDGWPPGGDPESAPPPPEPEGRIEKPMLEPEVLQHMEKVK